MHFHPTFMLDCPASIQAVILPILKRTRYPGATYPPSEASNSIDSSGRVLGFRLSSAIGMLESAFDGFAPHDFHRVLSTHTGSALPGMARTRGLNGQCRGVNPDSPILVLSGRASGQQSHRVQFTRSARRVGRVPGHAVVTKTHLDWSAWRSSSTTPGLNVGHPRPTTRGGRRRRQRR